MKPDEIAPKVDLVIDPRNVTTARSIVCTCTGVIDSAVEASAQVARQEVPPDSAVEAPASVGPQEARPSARPAGAAVSVRFAA